MDSNRNQLKEISIQEIMKIIQSKKPEYYNNILIDKTQKVLRANYIFYDFESMVVNRTVQKVKIPMYNNIDRAFQSLLDPSGNEKIKVIDQHTCGLLKQEGICDSDKNPENSVYLEREIEVDNESPKPTQDSYYFLGETYIEDCGECNGDKYIPCQDSECSGRHVWTCTGCHGKKQVTCEGCHGDGKIECKECGGDGKVKCGSWVGSGIVGSLGSTSAGCNGAGKIYVTKPGSKSGQKVQKKCSKCRGKGEVTCSNCTKGLVVCANCSGKKKVDCSTCSAKGDITCNQCYGNAITKKDIKYGKIDCPSCSATGRFGYTTFVETTLSNIEDSKISTLDQTISELDDAEIRKHVDSSYTKINTLVNINSAFKENLGEVEKGFVSQIRTDNNIYVDSYRKSLKEDLFCSVIPAVRVKYKHIITNTEHYLAVVNPFVKPELVFFSMPKESAQTSGAKKNMGQLSNFFGKLFKTKTFKSKQDKILEIKLMIRLMKADGKIDDGEKGFMIDKIGNIDGLMNKEKDSLFDFLNQPLLPKIAINDVVFSKKERFDECITVLNDMAKSDGEVDPTELEVIESVSSLYGEIESKKK